MYCGIYTAGILPSQPPRTDRDDGGRSPDYRPTLFGLPLDFLIDARQTLNHPIKQFGVVFSKHPPGVCTLRIGFEDDTTTKPTHPHTHTSKTSTSGNSHTHTPHTHVIFCQIFTETVATYSGEKCSHYYDKLPTRVEKYFASHARSA